MVSLRYLLGVVASLIAAAGCALPATEPDHAVLHQWQQQVNVASRDQSQVVPLLQRVGSAVLTHGDATGLAIADAVQPLLQLAYGGPTVLPGMDQLGLSVHTVQAGETPSAILRRYGMTNDLLQLLNPAYDDRRLGPGQQLKVFQRGARQVAVAVNKAAYRLMLVASLPGQPPQLLWVAPCGIGVSGRDTPVGVTTISNKVREPQWTHPDTREVIPHGDPRNVLGGYWIALAAGPDDRFRSIGFHGYTGAPASDWLEQPGSRGCIRLLQADINAVYALLPVGATVLITDG